MLTPCNVRLPTQNRLRHTTATPCPPHLPYGLSQCASTQLCMYSAAILGSFPRAPESPISFRDSPPPPHPSAPSSFSSHLFAQPPSSPAVPPPLPSSPFAKGLPLWDLLRLRLMHVPPPSSRGLGGEGGRTLCGGWGSMGGELQADDAAPWAQEAGWVRAVGELGLEEGGVGE